jgi:glycosyltransferase involved in cell wall biosynthesis
MDITNENKKRIVSIIIPAFNEAKTISAVIKTAHHHPWVDEILVIDDGSKDDTSSEARAAGATIYRLLSNQGKASAMALGVIHARNNIICFLDADLTEFNLQILTQILEPVITNQTDMFIGLRARHTYILNKLLRFFPIIGGERALKKELWLRTPTQYKKSFQIEIALNFFAKKYGYRMDYKIIPGFSQLIKEKKRGILKGLWQRMDMILDIIIISFKLYIIFSIKNLVAKKRKKFV